MATAIERVEEAAEWARRPAADGRTNYDHMLSTVLDAAEGGSDVRTVPICAAIGMDDSYWPYLVRLVIMDEPELVQWLEPRWCGLLDGQMGTAVLQLMFRDVTGRRPKVRSWRHAKEAMGL